MLNVVNINNLNKSLTINDNDTLVVNTTNGIKGVDFSVVKSKFVASKDVEEGMQEDEDNVTIGNVDDVTVSVSYNTVSITWIDPSDVIDNGNIVKEWAGTLLVRKLGATPVDINDGVLILNNTSQDQYADEPFIDTGLEYDETYYYRFFPYSTDDKYVKGSVVAADIAIPSVGVPVYTNATSRDSYNILRTVMYMNKLHEIDLTKFNGIHIDTPDSCNIINGELDSGKVVAGE